MVSSFNQSFIKAIGFFKVMSSNYDRDRTIYYKAGQVIRDLPLKNSEVKNEIEKAVMENNYLNIINYLKQQIVDFKI